jgi:uncharacterized protein
MSLLFFAAAVACFAYLVRGISGFGSAVIATPLLALVYPLPTVVPAILLLDTLGACMQAWQHRKHVVKAEFAQLLIYSLVGLAPGVWLLSRLDWQVLGLALGLFIIAFAIYQLLPLPSVSSARNLAPPLGFLGGLVDGAFGIGGPLYVLHLRLKRLDKTAFVATLAVLFAVLDVLRIGGYSMAGLYGERQIILAAVMLPLSVVGLFLGHRIHVRVHPASFNRLVSLVLLGSGIALLTRA